MDLISERIRRFLTALDCRKPGRMTTHRHAKIITSDPYVKVCLAGATVARTRVIPNSQDPIWDEHFKMIPLAHPVYEVEFQVKDNDVFGADFIGVAKVSARKVVSGEVIEDWFPINGACGKPPKPNTAIRLWMKFTPFHQNPLYHNGILENYGLKESYFPVRHGGAVTLYQDAHTAGLVPEIVLEEEKPFRHENCWEDICHSILEAHHLVYIVGWSIYHKVRLVREPTRPLPNGGNLNLGELLKYKSQEGVRVLLLVWDDKTSHSKFFINTVVGTLYTHHQKCVIVDAQSQGNNRKITAFIGGLDLCDGRYDTPQHRLFSDLDTVFKGDYHNPTFPEGGVKGPRQPWHDLHCKIEGPAAYDVLTNFEQRWRKASKWAELGRRFKKISHWHDDALLKIERISWITSPSSSVPNDDPSLWITSEEDPENWHVQVFRSIDSGSLKGFPKDVQTANSQNLVCAKDLVIDRSIQMAYIQAIRRAQHFVYIENQYFLGSSFAWPSYKDSGADNLIPMELALKIASKIRNKERFTVYIVIPMWPEGVPNSAPVQEILYWQITASQKSGRFMIYVHAKGMIVDDEYIILGSANINQRSMAGSRDTEIVMGAYQPYHTWASKQTHPHGQVYGYRMSLWAEHMGMIDPIFNEPAKLGCVTFVNKIARDNWERYTAAKFAPLQGHLLKYPVEVDCDGKLSPLPGYDNFPDVGGKVLGARTTLPDALTT
ncbi:unnamed protein product [Cuscuta campestris]|uniref:Phospholipase D n=1 Tax=Cuscuta campestris TaxID=132261 RepID=A0A484M8X4_9ASTE|nr:unnamed protein product [Cuscuta campestris]